MPKGKTAIQVLMFVLLKYNVKSKVKHIILMAGISNLIVCSGLPDTGAVKPAPREISSCLLGYVYMASFYVPMSIIPSTCHLILVLVEYSLAGKSFKNKLTIKYILQNSLALNRLSATAVDLRLHAKNVHTYIVMVMHKIICATAKYIWRVKR